MKSLLPSSTFRYSTILVLMIVCTFALIKSATSSAQEERASAGRSTTQEAGQLGESSPQQKADLLQRLISSDPNTKTPADGGTLIPSQVDAGTNLLVPSIAATKVATIVTDVDADGRADPGDTLKYTITISNTGTDASNVVFSDTIDVNTTLAGGTVNTSPIAFDDPGYSAAGNVRLSIVAASGVLVNDIDPDTGTNAGLTASAGATSAQGGNVVMSSNGSFTYNPFPGFTGTDTFTYTVTDGGGATGTGTVTINVTGMIWFIDASAGGGGDGRLTSPFNCYTGVGCFSAVAADDPSDNIFLYTGAYIGGNTLLANQRLIGQGATASLSTITGITPPTGSDALPTTGGTRPTITTVVAATNAINLGSGNTLRGFNVGNTTAADIAGTSFGTLTASDIDLNGTGAPLILTTGTLAATFGNLLTTSAAGGPGINLSSVGGTLTVTGTTSITGAGTQGINISGSSVAANFGTSTTIGSTTQGILIGTSTGNIGFGNTSITAGTDGVSLQNNTAGTRTFGTLSTTNGSGVGFLDNIGGNTTVTGTATFTNPGGRCIDIQNTTASNGVTFANVTATQCGGTGVFLSGNTGAMTFAALNITPNANQRGFHATNQTTGTITTTSGTISAPNATAVEVNNSSGTAPLAMTLTSVSSVGGTTPGIYLNRTSGVFSVAGGAANACTSAGTCTGGTITGKTGSSESSGTPGVRLNNVTNVRLTRMNIGSNNHSGIYGTTVNGFQLDTCNITNNGDSNVSNPDEEGVSLYELTGTTIGGSNPTSITNTTVSNNYETEVHVVNTTGTLTDLQVSGNTMSSSNASGVHGDIFQFIGQGSSNMKLTVTSGSFTGNAVPACSPCTADGIFANAGGTGGMTANISGATFTNNNVGINVSTDPVNLTFNFDIHNNNITASRATGINSFQNGNSPFGRTVNGKIQNNTVGTLGQVNSGSSNGRGIDISNEGAIPMTLLITGNIVQEVGVLGSGGAEGIGINIGLTGLATGGGLTSATITGNTIRDIRNSRGLIVSENQTTGPNFPTVCTDISGNTFTGTIAGQAGNGQFMRLRRGTNTFGVRQATPTAAANAAELDDANGFNDPTKISLAGSPTFSQPACSTPPIAPPANEARNEAPASSSNNLNYSVPSYQFSSELLANIQALFVQAVNAETSLNEGVLPNETSNLDSAISIPQWQPRLFAELNSRSVDHSVSTTTPGGTMLSNVESLNHAKAQEERRKVSDGNAEVRDHDPQEDKGQDGGIKPGTNGESPTKEPTKNASPDSGETVTVNGGSVNGFTLPAGKSITITFQVTINTGVLPAFTQVSNQGAISGSNFLSVILTDDPSVGGAADPTVTPIDHTTVAVSSNGNPSVFSQNVTFTATMTGVPSRVSDPPGTVQFKADGNNIGAAVPIVVGAMNDNVSTAQASISSLTVATHVITAEYSGGGAGATKYNANIGTLAGGQMVGKANTTTGVTSSQNPSVFGQQVTFTATIAPVAPGAGSVTGTVNFLDGGNPIASCQNVALSASQAQCLISTLVVGNHTISASYAGDSNFNTSSGNMTGNPQVVNKASTSVGLTSATNPSVFGQSVTFTATLGVTAPGAGTPTGTVQFLDGVNPIAGCTSVALAAGMAQCINSSLAVGNHTISAAYSGDGNFNTSNGSMAGNPQVVNKASTTVGLTSATNPSVFGQSVTFTATMGVTAPGAGTPTGTIQFLDGGNPIAGCTSVAIAAGQAQCSNSALAVGNHTVTAAYSGDGNFNTSNGSMTGNPQVVNKADTTVGLTSAANPSVFGQSVTFTATMAVTAPGAGTPTGTINFLDGGNPIAGCQNVAIAAGQGQCSSSALAVGNHTITADYSGDGNFNTSNGSMTGNPQVVNKANTSVGLVSDTNPSVFGQPVTFTATVAVTAPGAGTPTGTINFLDGGNPIVGCQNVTVQTLQAQCQPGSLSVGNHTITAEYSGDGSFNTSNGSMTGNPQVVNKADTSIGLTSSQNPAPMGTNITFTATISVAAPGAGTPSGTVQFLDGGNPITGCTAVAVAAGQAQCMTNALAAGNHTITSAYSGDGNFNTSNGSLTGNPQVITGAPVITPSVGLTRVAGEPATNSQVAVVSDDISSPGSITVTADTVPANMTITNIVNTNGTVTADISAGCGAATGPNVIVLKATDGKALSQTANLSINVTANPAPTLGNYPNSNIVVGCKLFSTPDAPPADNVSVSSVMAAGPGGFSGIISVDPVTGIVTITDNGPAGGPYTITVTVTDNCGTTFQRQFMVTVVNPPTAPTEFDFDGDRKADIAVYRPGATPSDPSFWYILRSSDGMFQFIQFGADNDVIVPGDYNGDGTTEVAIYRPSTQTWFTTLNPATNYGAFQWGAPGDIPVPGYYDNDNKTDIAVFRPTNGNWYIAKSTGGTEVRHWGQMGDKPIAADVDGDGMTDLVQYRETEFTFYILKSGGGTVVQTWGQTGDKIVMADYDGDGKDDIAIFRPATAFWYIIQSTGGTRIEQWGLPGADVPAPADYDNDGKADLMIYRTTTGGWHLFKSCPCTPLTTPFGLATDKPIPSAFTP